MKWTEITGAELNKPFKVAGLDGEFAIIEYYDNRSQLIEVVSRVPSGDILAGCSLTPNEFCAIIHAAPAGIIHLPPPLTDEQRTVLMALYTLGYRRLAKDENGATYAYDKQKLVKGLTVWLNQERGCSRIHDGMAEDAIIPLVSWSDPEPYDIGKALEIKR